MPSTPSVTNRPAQPYIAQRRLLTMQTMAAAAQSITEVLGWLAAHGAEPAGPPFFKYDVIDMERQLDIEVGVPVAAVIAPDAGLVAGVLPAGRFATVIHVGHPADLVATTAALLAWAAEQGERFDMLQQPDGEHWRCRIESYLTDPAEQPDMSQWQIELAFRLAD